MARESVLRGNGVNDEKRGPTYTVRSDVAEDPDVALVGQKSHGLRRFTRSGLPSPLGFTVTTDAFRAFAQHNQISRRLAELSERPTTEDEGAAIQAMFRAGAFPGAVEASIREAAAWLVGRLEGQRAGFAVRSSCTFEDLDGASFAGMYQSHLGVSEAALLESIKSCFASLYAPRALSYLAFTGVRADELAMGVLVQETIDAEASGALFTVEAQTGFSGNGTIEGVWGYGEGVVSGQITPTSWVLHKRTGLVIARALGDTRRGFQMLGGDMALQPTPADKHDRFCLEERELEWLFARAIELSKAEGKELDIEWVKSKSGKLVFVQARPLLVREQRSYVRYEVGAPPGGEPLARGTPITDKVVHGIARFASGARGREVPKGPDTILVAENLEVDWLPYLGDLKGVIVEGGGVTSHMSIILRERRIPALFGAKGALSRLVEGAPVTLVCTGSEGSVWPGTLSVKEVELDPARVPKPSTRICVVSSNIADIDRCLKLPLDGIGLTRLEFVIHERIGVHPLALVDYDRGALADDPALCAAIEERTKGYPSKREFYVEKLTEGICAFASRAVGRVINVRLPDFISNDYLALLGGARYESHADANPMMGFRGTSRLIDEACREAFAMDCEAFRRAFERHGFEDIRILVPFCRTPSDGRTIRGLLRELGPKSARVGMMVEIPSNVMLGEKFAEIFDFFLVGPMDLTQFTYAADRTSPKNHVYSSETEAVKEMVKCFLRNIQGRGKEVYIGGWPLFQYAGEYRPLLSNNKLHLVELPDRLVELFENVYQLERRLSADAERQTFLSTAAERHPGDPS